MPDDLLHLLTAPSPVRNGHENNFRFVDTPKHADLLIILPGSDVETIRDFRLCDFGHVLPLVDLTGRFADDADLSIPSDDPLTWARLANIAAAFRDRRHVLRLRTHQLTNPAYRLIAHLVVSQKTLRARYAPSHPSCVGYGAFPPIAEVETVAERLADMGLLKRKHFDRLHSCPQCASSRLSVREECCRCRSSEIADVGLLHHYRCAYLGPARDFEASGRRLICPKCGKELRHYGSDYERAGEAVQCAACGHLGHASAVGFVCMDCTARFDAAGASSRDAFHYELSEAALAFLTTDPSPELTEAMATGTLPSGRLHATRQWDCDGNPNLLFCEIKYGRQAVVEAAKGKHEYFRARRHFQQVLCSRLGSDAQLVVGRSHDYLLLKGTIGENVTHVRALVDETAARLKDDLAVELNVIDARQFRV